MKELLKTVEDKNTFRGVTTKVERITPEIAEVWLKNNRGGDRLGSLSHH